MDILRSGRPNPCHNCPDRYTACSDYCKKESFLKWKQEQEIIRKNRRNYKNPMWAGDEPHRSAGKKKQKW